MRNSHITIVCLVLILSLAFSVKTSANGADIGLNAFSTPTDFLSYNITGAEFVQEDFKIVPTVNIGDGKISPIWEEVTKYPVPAWGEEAEIGSIYGEQYIYFYFKQIVADSWIALQWDTNNVTNPDDFDGTVPKGMDADWDFWVFGTSVETEDLIFAGDYKTTGNFNFEPDISNEFFFERTLVNDTDGVTPLFYEWEIKRPFVTNDIDGADVSFEQDKNITLILASETIHKNSADLTVMKFSFTDIRAGGEVVINLPTFETPEIIAVDEYLKKTYTTGVLIFIITTLALWLPSRFVLKNEIRRKVQPTQEVKE